MIQEKKALLDWYLKAVRKELKCGGTDKQRLLGKVRTALVTYIEESNATDVQLLCEAFGQPDIVAASLMTEIPQRHIKIYQVCRYLRIALCAVLVVLIILGTIIIHREKSKVFTAESWVTYGETQEVEDGQGE